MNNYDEPHRNTNRKRGDIEAALIDYQTTSIPIADIVKKHKVSSTTLYQRARDLGIAQRLKTQLSAEDEKLVFELYTDHCITVNELADKFEVNAPAIRAAIRKQKTSTDLSFKNNIKAVDIKYGKFHEVVDTVTGVTINGVVQYVIMPIEDYEKMLDKDKPKD